MEHLMFDFKSVSVLKKYNNERINSSYECNLVVQC